MGAFYVCNFTHKKEVLFLMGSCCAPEACKRAADYTVGLFTLSLCPGWLCNMQGKLWDVILTWNIKQMLQNNNQNTLVSLCCLEKTSCYYTLLWSNTALICFTKLQHHGPPLRLHVIIFQLVFWRRGGTSALRWQLTGSRSQWRTVSSKPNLPWLVYLTCAY